MARYHLERSRLRLGSNDKKGGFERKKVIAVARREEREHLGVKFYIR